MTPRLLVFFVDGGTWTLLKPWMEQGKLPAFARLARDGATATLESVIPTETSYATAAFALGKHPAALGAFAPGSRGLIPATSEGFSGTRLWEALGEAGHRTLVMDFPGTWPPRTVNGVLFTGFFTPEDAEDHIVPPEIRARYPDYPRGGSELVRMLDQGKDALRDKVFEVTRRRFAAFRDACRREPYAFACFYVKGTDLLQHYFWDDPATLLDYWTAVDGMLAEALADGWTHVLVASDHGFDAAPRTTFSTNRWLADEGFLRLTARSGAGGAVRRFLAAHPGLARAYYQARHRLVGSRPAARTAVAADHLVEKAEGSGTVSKDVDVAKSAAYAPGGALNGKGIYLNRTATPPGSSAYDELRERIMARLAAVRLGDAPAFRAVLRGEDAYPGTEPAAIPDIVLQPVPGLFVEARVGRAAIGPRETRSRALGHHLASPDGILICRGPDIAPGERGTVSILDMYPTVLAWYGVGGPADLSGAAVPSLLGRAHVSAADDAAARRAIGELDL